MGKLLEMFQNANLVVNDLRDTLPVNPDVPFNLRELADISGMVVHHTAGWPQATAKGLATWSIEKRGFPGMPYTFYLRMPFSTESPPYPWAFCHKLKEWGPQAAGANSTTFGIALGGNFLYDRPPLWMVDSLARLIDVLWDFFVLEVGNSLWVNPHFDVSVTQCPGRVWEAYQEYE